jgi:hypothetical protein
MPPKSRREKKSVPAPTTRLRDAIESPEKQNRNVSATGSSRDETSAAGDVLQGDVSVRGETEGERRPKKSEPAPSTPFKDPIESPEKQNREVGGRSEDLTDEQVFYKCAYCGWSGKETGKEIIYEHMSGGPRANPRTHSSCTYIREGTKHKEKTDLRSGQADAILPPGKVSAYYKHVERDKDIAVNSSTFIRERKLHAGEVTQSGLAQPVKVEDSYPAVPLKLDGIAWSKVIVEQVRTMVTHVLDKIESGLAQDTPEQNGIVANLKKVKEVLDKELGDPLSSDQIEEQKQNIKNAYNLINKLIDLFQKSFIDIDELRARESANLERNKKEMEEAKAELSTQRTGIQLLQRQIKNAAKELLDLKKSGNQDHINAEEKLAGLQRQLDTASNTEQQLKGQMTENESELRNLKDSSSNASEQHSDTLKELQAKCNKCIIHIIEKYVALFILFLKRHIMVLTTNKEILIRSNMDDQSIQDTKEAQIQNLNTNKKSANALKNVIEGQGQSEAEKLKSIFPEAIDCFEKVIDTQEILRPIIVELGILVTLCDESLTLWGIVVQGSE